MILSVITLHLSLVALQADNYVEDVYFWPQTPTRDAQAELVPHYNPRAREIIFIEDSTSAQHPDTVRAIIREIK